MIMEPLVELLVTATTLTSYLAYPRQAMATLHVVSILLDVGMGSRSSARLPKILSNS